MSKANKAPATAKVQDKQPSKIAAAEAMLRRTEGATLQQLVEATGWQAHSVRGAMSGNLKKKRGLTIMSSKADDIRVYRIANEIVA